jgi:hypothetical protein
MYLSKHIFITVLFMAVVSGLFAQTSDTVSISKQNKFNTRIILETGIPLAMVTYGIISLHNKPLLEIDHSTDYELHEDNMMFYHKSDDILQFAPGAATFGLHLMKIKSAHNLPDMAILYTLSNLLETAIVYPTKTLTLRTRPDGSKDNSFPSGHTATAFVGAEFLYQEYKDKSVWIGVGGYTVATLVGLSRIYNDRHWVSDVITGAGIGILSTKAVYWVYPYLQKSFGKKGKSNLNTLIYPSYGNNTLSLHLSYGF